MIVGLPVVLTTLGDLHYIMSTQNLDYFYHTISMYVECGGISIVI